MAASKERELIYYISDGEQSESYDAKIELDGTDVQLHSRGGATGGRPPRNVDYEKALFTIISRLRAGENTDRRGIARVLIDSLPTRKLPAEQRVIVEARELSGLNDDEAVSFIRLKAKNFGQATGVSGGNSTKALRIETKGHSHESVLSTLKLINGSRKSYKDRLSAGEQNKVTTAHIHAAIGRLQAGEDAPNFDGSRDYDVLLDDGMRLAPKKVFGLALEEALGIDTLPKHFSAGWGQPSFRIITSAGYLIVPKNEQAPTAGEIAQAQNILPSDAEGSSEGTLKLVIHMRRERDPSLSKDKKAAFIEEYGILFCERCRMKPSEHYDPKVAAACIEVHHAKVQVKDMQLGHVTTLEDLQCLCANCHRVTHRELATVSEGSGKPMITLAND